jgi:hypothetical protein
MRWFESERSTSLRRVSEAAMAITLAGGVGLVGLGWMPEAWLGWLLVGQCIIAAWWILAGLVGQGLEHFHEPRRLTIGWGRWRLVAWGQLRLSDGLFWGPRPDDRAWARTRRVGSPPPGISRRADAPVAADPLAHRPPWHRDRPLRHAPGLARGRAPPLARAMVRGAADRGHGVSASTPAAPVARPAPSLPAATRGRGPR